MELIGSDEVFGLLVDTPSFIGRLQLRRDRSGDDRAKDIGELCPESLYLR